MRLLSVYALPALAMLVLSACDAGKNPEDSVPTDTDTDSDTDTDTDTDSDSDSDTQVTDADGDGYTTEDGDCNDADEYVYPGSAEKCDDIDNNCNGQIDEGATDVFYADADGDGYGLENEATTACDAPSGYAAESGDCDDGDAAYHPGAAEDDCTDPNDYNCDGSAGTIDADADGFYACEECDDANRAVNPNAAEVCNEVDDDCDGTIDVGATDAGTWYTDADSDGYGDDASATVTCEAAAGDVAVGGDCDDTDPAFNPAASETDCADPNDYNCDGSTGLDDADGDGETACTECDDSDPAVNSAAAEVCDGIDNNCDGSIDEAGATGTTTFYVDLDGDGYGDDTVTVESCTAPDGYVAVAGDCDDLDENWHPAAAEDCSDANDYNCDGSTGYADADGDGTAACEDCDDTEALSYPGNLEICDGVDNDCDGSADNDAVNASTVYADADGDGYGDATSQLRTCDDVAGFVSNDADCDDADATYNPGALETCTDVVDFNCDGSIGTEDADADGFAACEECDDSDGLVNPDAVEACDGVDNNCDGTIDEAGATGETTWYADVDGDGYGDASDAVTSCSSPAGYVADDTDCDDTSTRYHPGATESDCSDPNDYNCDGSAGSSDNDADGFASCEDCNDRSNVAFPGGTEVCDGVDNDCNGVSDGPDATDISNWYLDSDLDSYGDPAVRITTCDAPAGFVSDFADCDDSRDQDHPGGTEVCDNHDNDCDGTADDSAIDADTWYADLDGDSYGDPDNASVACDQPTNYVADNSDCNDDSDKSFPLATELCDGLDNDCNGIVDDGLSSHWYADMDGDGYGDADSMVDSCVKPTGYVSNATDCDDLDGTTHPGVMETCDGVDNDCNSLVDEGLTILQWPDVDSDGYGDMDSPTMVCGSTPGFVADDNDCDDADAAINPTAADVCDGVDNDCTGLADDDYTYTATWYDDLDGDGYGDPLAQTESCDQPLDTVANDTDCDDGAASAHPGGTETCDDLDNDCNGLVDDGATDLQTYYVDADSDGYGTAISTVSCSTPSGYAALTGDCDDTLATRNPGETEVCDGIDNDCDTAVDEGAFDITTWYQDLDHDSYGSTVSTDSCAAPSGYVSTGGDCDDGSSAVNPAASEVCDSLDNDCDTLVDDSPMDGTKLYYDYDYDGYGGTSFTHACSASSGLSATSTDCDDADANTYPSAPEVCDSTDNDCDSSVDESAVDADNWYYDFDADGYGDSTIVTASCTEPAAYVADATDCNDHAASVNPAAAETCNGVDDDCDTLIDDGATGGTTWYYDADGDGYGGSATTQVACDQPASYYATSDDCDDAAIAVNPGAAEVCEDGLDNDCDSSGLDCRYATASSLDSVGFGLDEASAATDAWFGSGVTGGLDVYGDATIDVAVGASGSGGVGAVYLWDGNALTATSAGAAATWTGAESGEHFGDAVAFTPDLDSDGLAEIVVGAPFRTGSTGSSSGGVYLFPGGSAGGDATTAFSTITGTTANQAAGYVVFGGDFGGTTSGDIGLTAPANLASSTTPGTLDVFYDGVGAGTVLTSAADLVITGSVVGDRFGSAASAGDIDGDGFDDIVVGAPASSSGAPNAGRAYVLLCDGTTGSVAASAVDLVLTSSTNNASLGAGAAFLGDVDGDGYGDLAVGAPGTTSGKGRVYLLDGSSIASGSLSGTKAASSSASVTLDGATAGDGFGTTMATAGDVDNDGFADFLVAAAGYDAGTTPNTGAVYLEYGSASLTPSASATWYTSNPESGSATTDISLPFALSGIGDIDSDGYDDIGIGAPLDDGAMVDSGSAWVVYGTGE